MIFTKCFLLICRFRIRQFYRCIALAGFLRSLYTIIVHKYHFCIGKWKIKTAKCINCRHHGTEIHSYIICNIQIQHGIQHRKCLLRATVCISRIGLGVHVISNIQESISVNRSKLYLFGVIIDTCNNNSITVLCIKGSILGTLINRKQCICGITGHLRSGYIRNNLTLIQLRCLDFI